MSEEAVRPVSTTARSPGVDATPALQRMVLSLEESPDLDATAIEALCDFAAYVRVRGVRLSLARVKDEVRDLLAKVNSPDLHAPVYAPWSVDDAVQPVASTPLTDTSRPSTSEPRP
jgi:MFS superfamily sulfate permease-like transporter